MVSGTDGGGELGVGGYHATRLNQFSGSSTTAVIVVGLSRLGKAAAIQLSSSMMACWLMMVNSFYPVVDSFVAAGDPFGAIKGSTTVAGWGLETETKIPEIDIKVDSVAVTAVTKKLKAKWSPELAQDLNAYHNLDAEVELTSVLSEQIALEIDQEILSDLVSGATAQPFIGVACLVSLLTVKTEAFSEARSSQTSPERLAEWYETLLETVNEVSARIHRKTLRGGANFIVLSPELANILEFTSWIPCCGRR